MIDSFFNPNMASAQANEIVHQMRTLLKERRLLSTDESTGAPLSLRAFSAKHDLDPSMVSRIENIEETRVPAINFWVDITMALGCTIGDLQQDAIDRVKSGDQK